MLEFLQIALTIIVVAISFLSIILVLMQSSKGGGGIFGDASASQSVIGSERRGDFFTKLTSIFLGIFIVGSFGLAYLKKQERVTIEVPENYEVGTPAKKNPPTPELPKVEQLPKGKETTTNIPDANKPKAEVPKTPTDQQNKPVDTKPEAEKKPANNEPGNPLGLGNN